MRKAPSPLPQSSAQHRHQSHCFTFSTQETSSRSKDLVLTQRPQRAPVSALSEHPTTRSTASFASAPKTRRVSSPQPQQQPRAHKEGTRGDDGTTKEKGRSLSFLMVQNRVLWIKRQRSIRETSKTTINPPQEKQTQRRRGGTNDVI